MTTTFVKNIGAVAGASNRTAPNVKMPGQTSFEAVWTKQTDQGNAEQTSSNNKATSKRDDTVVRDSLKSKDTGRDVVKKGKASDATDAEGKDWRNMDAAEWDAAMEVLGTAAQKLIQQIAESFGMEPEEVEAMMSELSVSQTDVLNTDKLAQLLLMAGGAEDMTALLTDGELYQLYQNLMEQAQTLLNESSEILGVDAKQLVDSLDEQTRMPFEQEELPIEISVETERATEDTAETSDLQTQTLTAKQPEKGGTTEQTSERDAQHRENGAGYAEHGNILLQHMKETQFAAQTAQTKEASSVWDADTQDIMRQIMDFMRIQLKPEMSDLEMQLHPEHLGNLQIHVAAKDGTITAQFIAQNESVRAALESQMVQLKENFAEQGVKVEAIEVTVQTHQFEQNLEQGRDRGQNEPKRARTHKIHLDGPLSMEEIDAMDEDEQLAAQMMEANGNTVDYTA